MINHILQNATIASLTNSFSGLSIISIIIVVIVGGVILALTSLATFQRVQYALKKVGRVFYLFLKGSGIAVTGYGVYLGAKMLSDFGEFINFEPIWLVYGAVGFASLTLLGYGGEKVFDKIMSNYHTLYHIAEKTNVNDILHENVKETKP